MKNSPYSNMKQVLLICAVVALVGCATTPDGDADDWDWSTQTGTLTFDQAKIELGTPFYTRPSSVGGTVAVWRGVAGWTYSSSRLIDKAGTTIGGTTAVKAKATSYEHALLHFDKDGKLVSGSGFGPRKKAGKNQ